ncbi:acyl-CoA dehydrogenase family protein [Streptomyces sp. 8N616]|uniref:acyl-CoA dehydrogenase family protein n=1 Tax=Streptomyces sp. 8N616 TaxID=3457414 RepID=UPI003FD2B76E
MTAGFPRIDREGEERPVAGLTAVLNELSGPDEPFCAQEVERLDRSELFPAAACRVLDDFGLPGYYVPAEHGGRFDDFGVLAGMLRAVSRIDLTTAVAHGKTYLGAVPTWIAGEPDRAAWLGERVAHGAVVSCALSERHHGSDLLAGEVTAERAGADEGPGGWLLTGEKWLINNVTRADLVTVLARTDPAGGPRGFSLFLVDKAQLDPDSFTCLPKVPTYGIRGADISGIAFHGACVPADALIGGEGQGVEIILKALHLTRTVCVSMSLGAADHALRLAAQLCVRAEDEGRPLLEQPYARRELGEAVAGLLLAEALSVVAVRGVHGLTREMSVISAVAKARVPAQVDELITRLARAFGPYGLLAEHHADGAFAKVERDHRIIGIFDGSSLVNRNALIDQFPRLTRAYRKGSWDAAGLAEAATVHEPVSPLRPADLTLVSSGGASVVASLPETVAGIRELAAQGRASAELADLAGRLADVADELHDEMADMTVMPRAVPPAAFELAERFEVCFAAASGLHLWLRGASRTRPADDTWLRGTLVKALTELGAETGPSGYEIYGRLADSLAACPSDTPFSLLNYLGAEAS